MANVLILAPASIAAIASSRGDDVANLLTPDPREDWADSTSGSAATIDIDLGSVQSIDTIFLGYVSPPGAGATWTITGGTAGYTGLTIKSSGSLRAADSTGQAPPTSHAFWHGDPVSVRYVRLSLTQASGDPLSAGVAMLGLAFQPAKGREWGSGRAPIDTGSASSLLSGGFAIEEGIRKGSFSWTFGDLTDDEVEALWAIHLDRGSTRPVLIVEDPSTSAGLRNRIHYGLLTGLKKFERQQANRTRWELSMEDWI